jgi:UDP-N-acetylmuramoyl-L-alanyl-D-glutamate--2,6-diaminopimelate ligase
MKSLLKRLLPKKILNLLLPLYHFSLALTGAVRYGFPSRKLVVIGVTGTKGKTSTTEILNNILESGGKKTAVLGTLRFKVGEQSERNLKKMTMPGRFFVQKFLHDAVLAECTHAIIEMTSEGAKQFRQCFIDMDALIFTNLSPEHIESHGSYENYRDAKLSIARTLARSSKNKRFMVANVDDKEGALFLAVNGVTKVPYGRTSCEPIETDATHSSISWRGARVESELPGLFNVYNIIAAATCAEALGIEQGAIIKGITNTTRIEGRAERIDAGQHFPVIVDYAHTPDSLEALYTTFVGYENICILGNTGGGRDKWKRPVMGDIADKYCTEVILTNEDPYDEDPRAILEAIASGMKNKKPTIILDRREAIAYGIVTAKKYKHPTLLITGKGTDPYIMGPNGTKTPWDDRVVAKEELEKARQQRP